MRKNVKGSEPFTGRAVRGAYRNLNLSVLGYARIPETRSVREQRMV